ncbi:glycoside hydrolase [Diplogelasinospora grovesii]|uniref:Glycoside hydrolase n=1 Tax=Diplogelasinospora grovesii TaxID=303347 RepID=A0AAN6N3I6_9PEZI|nr:glycoside hydrolase [Diplogelasinospora grovesii]
MKQAFFSFILSLFLLSWSQVRAAKEVFAHVIVGNVNAFAVADWEGDIDLAKASLIDGFVLNIAAKDTNNGPSLDAAFQAANNKQFKLFFSFDYLAEGPWPKEQVIQLLQKFGNDTAYFKQGTQPFASTFEGPANSADWTDIKAQTGAFFVPDWSSISAADAVATGVVDGLFSFNAWPDGPTNISTAPDQTFRDALGTGKVYIMPVAPWFFTNLPGFNKNWLWRGDELWDDRWQQVLDFKPDFVEILTWNDYGESHYIGPLNDKEFGLFASANAPFNYADKMAHDGWRKFLPFYIDAFKSGTQPQVTEESAVAYYRPNPALACQNGGTTGNNKDFGQTELPPDQLVEDKVFYSALLNSPAEVSVSIGGNVQNGTFSKTPAGGGQAGVYQGSVGFKNSTGEVVVTVTRGGQTVAEVKGGPGISTQCASGIENWNAFCGSS